LRRLAFAARLAAKLLAPMAASDWLTIPDGAYECDCESVHWDRSGRA
jgi:hypothetical protein